jgi:hypothetical protein
MKTFAKTLVGSAIDNKVAAVHLLLGLCELATLRPIAW